MDRKPFIAGNWKMYLNRASIAELVKAIKPLAAALPRIEVAFFPPFPYIAEVARMTEGKIAVGGQDIYFEKEGAFTGQVSAGMLKDVGATYVLVGHSERRHIFGDTSEITARKVLAALDARLSPVLCVGELLDERKAGQTVKVVRGQIEKGLAGCEAAGLAGLIIAYEPVWAIGTGVTATTAQAGEAHGEIRRLLGSLFGPEHARRARILYGGSVKPENVDELMSTPDIDGVLVGGASLKPASFGRIVEFKSPA